MEPPPPSAPPTVAPAEVNWVEDTSPADGLSDSNGVSRPSTSEEPAQSVPFEAARIEEFWAEVLAQAPDRLTAHFGKADKVAISGPNALEVSFPHSYVLSRQFCERSETLDRIAELASRVAGRSIRVKVIASTTPGEAPALQRTVSRQEPAGRAKKAQVNSDPFVQQALDIFGGTLIDAREIHETAGEGR